MLKQRFRDAVVLCGLSWAIGTGLVAFTQAQSPDEPPQKPRERLIERLVALRTEVELLQIEHDVDRDDLVKTMTDLRKLRRDGLDREELDYIKSTVSIVDSGQSSKAMIPLLESLPNLPPGAASQLKAAKEAGPLSDIYEDLLKSEEGRVELKDAGVTKEEFLKSLQNPEALGKLLVRTMAKGKDRKLVTEIEEKKRAFARLASELNLKKLDLDEAEARHKAIH